MRKWVAAAQALSRRFLSLDPARLGEDVLLQRVGLAAEARRDVMFDYLHMDALRRGLAFVRPDVLIDVGANRGQFGQLMRRLGFQGRVLSIEPLPEVFRLLQETSRGDPAWTTVNIAIAEEDGTAEFHVSREDQFSSLLPRTPYAEARFGPRAGVAQTMRVPVRRLDQIVPEYIAGLDSPRIFLKLDTQGYDVRAFRSLGDLRQSVALLHAEVAVLSLYEGVPDFVDAIAEYQASGLRLMDLFPVARDEHDLASIEFDCLLWRSPPRPRSTWVPQANPG